MIYRTVGVCMVIHDILDYIDSELKKSFDKNMTVLFKDGNDISPTPYTVFYMNGENDTETVYRSNRETPEFSVFYSNGEQRGHKCFTVKVSNNRIVGTLYHRQNDDYSNLNETSEFFKIQTVPSNELITDTEKRTVDIFAYQLMVYADNKNIVDHPVFDINFSHMINWNTASEYWKALSPSYRNTAERRREHEVINSWSKLKSKFSNF